MKLINTSKVSTDNKITIVKKAAEKLNLSKGDIVGFFEDENKNIVIKKIVTSQ